jgi:hypothetical protein
VPRGKIGGSLVAHAAEETADLVGGAVRRLILDKMPGIRRKTELEVGKNS